MGKWVQDVARWQGVVCQWGWGVLVFNTGDDGGEKLLEATLPQQVRTNRSSPGDGQLDRKRESSPAFRLPFFLLVFKFLKTPSSVTRGTIKKISWAMGHM